jgi:hypothetical protein
MDVKKSEVKLEFKKDNINAYNENFENTMGNIYALAVLSHQVFARLGYQIKLQEQILIELKKLNKGN